jgi:hypothetical protein
MFVFVAPPLLCRFCQIIILRFSCKLSGVIVVGIEWSHKMSKFFLYYSGSWIFLSLVHTSNFSPPDRCDWQVTSPACKDLEMYTKSDSVYLYFCVPDCQFINLHLLGQWNSATVDSVYRPPPACACNYRKNFSLFLIIFIICHYF